MNKIKTERIKHGLTQGQLSNLTGIPARTIQNWENGVRKCPGYMEQMILDTLDRTFNQPDYQTIVEELLSMLQSDLKHIDNVDTLQYVKNVISNIQDALE